MLATAHDLLQPTALLIRQPPRPHRLSHPAPTTRFIVTDRVWKQAPSMSADPGERMWSPH